MRDRAPGSYVGVSTAQPSRYRARASLAKCAALVALLACCNARASDPLQTCKAPPRLEKLAQPEFPSDVEVRGLPNPVTVLVEFTLGRNGSASDPIAVESDASSYAKQFESRAVRAILKTRFKPTTAECRGRMRVTFKIVSGPHA